MGAKYHISPAGRRRSASRRAALVVAVLPVAGALALTAASPAGAPAKRPAADGDGSLGSYYDQSVDWTDCGRKVAEAAKETGRKPPGYLKRLQCSRVRVPRDYAATDRGNLHLAVARLPATGAKSDRIGSLVLNFGGPGESGVEGLGGLGAKFTKLNERYDIVAPDPRGVGDSTPPVQCASPSARQAKSLDRSPDDRAEIDKLASFRELQGKLCEEDSGKLLPWVGTADSARDLDVLRGVLGEDKLTYLGFSYGTKLGANYLHLFPRRTGRVVLDGVENPMKNSEQTYLANAHAFQRALDDFTKDCTKRGASECPLGDDTAKAKKETRQLFSLLDKREIDTAAGELDQSTFVDALKNAMYSEKLWPDLRHALSALGDGNGAPMVRLAGGSGGAAARGAGVPGAGLLATAAEGNADAAFTAVTCRDTSDRYTAADVEQAKGEFTKASPVFGTFMAGQMLTCTGWPVPGDNESRQVRATKAPAALLVATTGDPATPYRGGADMAKELDNDSVVLTFESVGHTGYITGDSCVDGNVNDFLLDGKRPKKGTRCD
ncbi:alpha/beta hydrolase [Streptomyces sp. CMB-StM0423]|uniref:alpha/beta hydrolase n=1 Tax=Streptomyces sp. CMB-StM0423 TaxID=2059884 RepID=UPI000C70C7BD|nr:alpha/beta hydrolase [Streptomyces sp. CMB-StM0423]AUH43379.1 alpha/beta hydrolase [Streptomyces sp. CMB-StM0423]